MGNLDKDTQARINQWLTNEYDQDTVAQVQKLVDNNEETELLDSFYKELEFGTGGLRGIMGVGSNRMNKYTIGKATQGLANYLLKQFPNQDIKVAVTYDSRNNSQAFGNLVADVFSANGIHVYLFEELRPTPVLSFTVRHFECQGGVMLTASHNPKEYNGYKAYWNDGGQIIAPHDKNIITEVLAEDPGRVRIAFIGRPNVGKSTLVNRLLGEERMIASDVPGTTRDSIAVDLERDGREYRLIDTAGLRRRSRVDEVVEKFSVVKTMQSIEQCQVAVLMLDATEGVTDQDATVLGAVLDAGRALVIAINKWDGLTDYQREQAETMLSLRLGFVPWAESVRISAKHGSGLRELFRAVHRAHESANKTFTTSEVNKALEVAYETNPPPTIRGHVSKLRYVHPAGANPPTFIVHGTRLKELQESYKRYLENFFRKRFKLIGTPVSFIFREGTNPYEGKKNVLTERQVKAKRRLMKHVKGK